MPRLLAAAFLLAITGTQCSRPFAPDLPGERTLVFVWNETHSLAVAGRLSDADVEAIRSLVLTLDEGPILRIQVLTPDHVDVWTGAVRGPLDGGGRVFRLNRRSGRWVEDESQGVGGRVS